MNTQVNIKGFIKSIDTKTWVIVGLVVFLFFSIKGCRDNANDYNTISDNYSILNDSLTKSVNDLGQEKSRIRVLKGQNKKALLQLKTSDSTVIKLQELVSNYKGKLSAAIVLNNSTTERGITETTIIHDTLYNDVYETYFTEWDEEWSKGEIIAKRSSIERNITFYNSFDITIGEEKSGWFGKRDLEISIVNKNPNTITKDLESFNIQPNPKRYSLGVGVGYGLGSNFTLQPFIGVMVQYKIKDF